MQRTHPVVQHPIISYHPHNNIPNSYQDYINCLPTNIIYLNLSNTNIHGQLPGLLPDLTRLVNLKKSSL